MKKTVFLLFAFSLFARILPAQSDQFVMRPALVVMDVQKFYLPMMSKEDQPRAIETMNKAIRLFREYGFPVIRVYHTSEKRGPKPGDPGFEFSDSLQIEPSDPKVIKTYSSAFTKTNLNAILQEKGINTLFFCGMSSIGCALATFFDAENYDYRGLLVRDALLGPDSKYTDQVETIFRAKSLGTIREWFEKGRD